VSEGPTSGDGRLSSYSPLKREDILRLHRLGKLSREQLATWERMRGKVRNRILSLVREGRLSPAQAEGWTKKRGEESFETPDRAKLGDPISLPNWTLAMATAWIIWRSPDAVRDSWNDYRCECYGWDRIPIGGSGLQRMAWELRRLPPVSRSTVRSWAFRQDEPTNQIESPTRACALLDHKLQSGDVEATGIPHGGTGRVRIPPHEWIDFSYLNDDDQRPESIFSEEGVEPRYDVVRVRSSDVMREWKPNVAEVVSRDEATIPVSPSRRTRLRTIRESPPAAVSPVGGRPEFQTKPGLRPVGRPPRKGDDILAQMREMSLLDLRELSEKQMEHSFGAARSTCRKYRKQVLAENGDN
jgi:hypothetical protein